MYVHAAGITTHHILMVNFIQIAWFLHIVCLEEFNEGCVKPFHWAHNAIYLEDQIPKAEEEILVCIEQSRDDCVENISWGRN